MIPDKDHELISQEIVKIEDKMKAKIQEGLSKKRATFSDKIKHKVSDITEKLLKKYHERQK